MRTFWDERAREDAFYFVDSRLRYRDPDLDEFWAGGQEVMDVLCRELGVSIEPSDTAIEIGCGVGRLTRVLSARAERVIALDISEEMLQRARDLNPDCRNVEWLLGDGSALTGVDDGRGDVLVSQVVLQHIPDPAITLSYIREIGRVLRPGGWAVVQVSNNPDIHRPRTPLRWRLRAFAGRRPHGQDHPAWLGSAVEIDDVRAAAADGRLDLERVWGEGEQFCQLLLRKVDENCPGMGTAS